MSTDLSPEFQDAEDPSPHPPEMGHSEANWGSSQLYELDDPQFQATGVMAKFLDDYFQPRYCPRKQDKQSQKTQDSRQGHKTRRNACLPRLD
jgi:hypothetical protein